MEVIRAHKDDVNAVAFMDDSTQLIASGSDDALCKASLSLLLFGCAVGARSVCKVCHALFLQSSSISTAWPAASNHLLLTVWLADHKMPCIQEVAR